MGGGGVVAGMPPAVVVLAALLLEELLEKGLEKLNRLLLLLGDPELDDDETVDAGLFWPLAWICLTVTPAAAFFAMADDELLSSDFFKLNNFIVRLGGEW